MTTPKDFHITDMAHFYGGFRVRNRQELPPGGSLAPMELVVLYLCKGIQQVTLKTAGHIAAGGCPHCSMGCRRYMGSPACETPPTHAA